MAADLYSTNLLALAARLRAERLTDPDGVLAWLCTRCGIPDDPAMRRWEPGPKPEDGVWAPFWYENVHRSTGFGPPAGARRPVPDRTQPVLEQAMPLYERLARYVVD